MSATTDAPPVPDQRGRLAIVTGIGGLGLATATALARAGAEVVIAGRNPAKGADALAAIALAVPRANVSFERLDLASLSSIASFADRMLATRSRLDMLVNNAGIMSPPKRTLTEDGFELQFGVNHLGHFALTGRLLPLLQASGAGRIVTVTSLAQHQGRIAFDDLQSSRRYRPGLAYCQSKLTQAVFAVELQRRLDRAGLPVISVAAHPGLAATALFENGSGGRTALSILTKYLFLPLLGQSADAGAMPTIHAATSPMVGGGSLYGPTGRFQMKGGPGPNAFARTALSPEIGARLWAVSGTLTGMSFLI